MKGDVSTDMNRHQPFERLVDLVDGRLGLHEQARVGEHVGACAICAADVAWLERTTTLLRAVAAPVAGPRPRFVAAAPAITSGLTDTPPAAAVARVLRLFQRRQETVLDAPRFDRPEPGGPSLNGHRLDRWAADGPGLICAGRRPLVPAVLRFDSDQVGLVAGLRGAVPPTAGAAPVRQLLYDAGGHEIELQIVGAGPEWGISGQVFSPPVAGPLAAETLPEDLRPGDRTIDLHGPAGEARGELDEHSEFVLPPVPPGTYTLTLRLEDVEVAVERLALPMRPQR